MRKNSMFVIIFLALLLIIAPQSSILNLSSNEMVRSSTLALDTLYIDSDYTFTEDISTPIEVIADKVVIDGAGHSLLGPGGDMSLIGISVYNGYKVTIKNLVVEGWERGIVVYGGEKNKILDNTVRYCGIGVDVTLSENTRIMRNVASDNGYIGFYTYGCSKDHYLGNTANYNVWAGFLIESSIKGRFVDNTAIGNGEGIYVFSSAFNKIIENTCTDNVRGIWLHCSSENTVSDNICSNNLWGGLPLWESHMNVVSENTCSENGLSGIYLQDSNENDVEGNLCTGNAYSGIYLYISSMNTIAENVVADNEMDGISLTAGSNDNLVSENSCTGNGHGGIWLSDSHNNELQGNFAANNAVDYWLEYSDYNTLAENTAIGERGGNFFTVDSGFLLAYSGHNHLEGNIVSVTHNGFKLWYSNENTIVENTVTGAYHGIRLFHSSNNLIESNSVTNIDSNGFYLYDGSNDNFLSGNIATYCGHGFRLGDSWVQDWELHIVVHSPVEGNVLIDNTATHCWWTGFELQASDWNILEDNTATDNLAGIRLEWGCANNLVTGNIIAATAGQDAGIRIWGCDNTITENTISGNHWWGISIDYGDEWGINSHGNYIYHNNLIDNIHQASDWDPENNYWYHPVLFEGNYWSDYTGVDDGSDGRIARDGIGDTDIPWYYDWYPYMNQNGWI